MWPLYLPQFAPLNLYLWWPELWPFTLIRDYLTPFEWYIAKQLQELWLFPWPWLLGRNESTMFFSQAEDQPDPKVAFVKLLLRPPTHFGMKLTPISRPSNVKNRWISMEGCPQTEVAFLDHDTHTHIYIYIYSLVYVMIIRTCTHIYIIIHNISSQL